MIKLFRHMRKDEIGNGSNGKYFKYAIGEILLVVIGILIALQINNWNEDRKEREQEVILTHSIKQDLEADLSYLKTFAVKVDSSHKILINQSERVNRISDNKDSLVNFLKNDIDVLMISFEGYNNNTFVSMKASGKLEILNETLKTQLYELSYMQETALEVYHTLRDDYFDEIEALSASFPVPVPFSFIKITPKNNYIWENMDMRDIMLKLNSWGTIKANFYRSVLGRNNKIIETTESILNQLNGDR